MLLVLLNAAEPLLYVFGYDPGMIGVVGSFKVDPDLVEGNVLYLEVGLLLVEIAEWKRGYLCSAKS